MRSHPPFVTRLASAALLCGLARAAQEVDGFLPPGYSTPVGPLLVAPDANLLDLVHAFQAATGQEIVLEGDVQETLRSRHANLLRPLEVSGPAACTVLEALLAENGLGLTLAGPVEGRQLAITPPDSGPGGVPLSERALSLTPAEVLRLREHPALLVSTVIDPGGVDVRFLANALRTCITDARVQAIQPVASGDGLVVSGPARWVSTLVAALDPSAPEAAASNDPERSVTSAFLVQQDATLLDLLSAFGQAADRHFACSESMRQTLGATRIRLTQDLAVPAEDAERVVELVLRDAGVVLTEYRAGATELCTLTELGSAARATVRGMAPFVPVAGIDTARAHAARIAATVVRLPGVDTRQLSNSLRTTITDANLQQLLPLGSSDRMLVVGPGVELASMVELLRTISSAAQGETPHGDGLPEPEPASGPLLVDPDTTLLDLARQYEEVGGSRFLFDGETWEALAARRLGVLRPFDVPPTSVHEVFELLLARNEFVLTDLGARGTRLFGITWLGGAPRATVRAAASFVGAPTDALRRHPARLFLTFLDLPGVDTRFLANAMRATITDANLEQMLPVGNANAILLLGLGTRLDARVRELRGALAPELRGASSTAPAPRLALPAPSAPLVVEVGSTLLDVLAAFEERTGARFVMSPETLELARATPTSLAETRSFEPPVAQAALEMLLASSEFLVQVHSVEPPLATVSSLRLEERQGICATAVLAPEEVVGELAAHPAVMASTVVHLPGLPVRTLLNSLRTLIVDANVQRAAPLGNTDGVLLTGPAPWVESMARLLRGFLPEGEAATLEPAFPVFPEAREPLALRRGTDLSAVVREYERLTGASVALDAQVAQRLARAVIDLPQDLLVPAARVQATVESLLVEGGFVLTAHAGAGPLQLSVASLEDVNRRILFRGSGLFVPESQLDSLEGHPGLYVHTALRLPGVDVQQLASSPTAELFAEVQGRRMIAVPDGSAVVLVGLGAEVRQLAETLRRLVPSAGQDR